MRHPELVEGSSALEISIPARSLDFARDDAFLVGWQNKQLDKSEFEDEKQDFPVGSPAFIDPIAAAKYVVPPRH